MGLIVLIFMTFSTAALASQDACVNTGQLLPPIENKELWIGLSKEFAIEAAKKNLKGFPLREKKRSKTNTKLNE